VCFFITDRVGEIAENISSFDMVSRSAFTLAIEVDASEKREALLESKYQERQVPDRQSPSSSARKLGHS
jgi:hypothetical protein